MDTKVLSQIIPAATGKELDRLLKVITALEESEDLFAGFIYGHGNDNRFLYLSPSIEKITGYPPATFQCATGYQFFYLITPEEYRAHIAERAAFYTRQAKESGFSIIHSPLMEMKGGLYHKSGEVSKIRFLAIVLEFTHEKDILFSLCTWQKVDFFSEAKLTAMMEKIYRLLITFKDIYVSLHPDKFRYNGFFKNEVLKVVYPLYQGPVVTKKEYEVLRLISNGCSSKQIAQHLNISFHTAETHRKHLLGKFQAVNSAELMKKATKVFWFE